MAHQHETWMDDRQREPRTIREAFQIDTDGDEAKSDDDEERKQARQLADQERREEDYLDTERGVWGPTE
jgi:hypothetical protein